MSIAPISSSSLASKISVSALQWKVIAVVSLVALGIFFLIRCGLFEKSPSPDKLAAYQYMPAGDLPFLQKSVDLLQSTEPLDQDDPNVFEKVAVCATRAFIFSNQRSLFPSYFLIDPIWSTLDQAKRNFKNLSRQEKELIIDLEDSRNISTLDLSKVGRKVVQDIGTVATHLIQTKGFYKLIPRLY